MRFDAGDSYSATRFATAEAYVDVTVGLDGRVYALQDDEQTVDVFEPNTLASFGSVTLANDVRAISVNAAGLIFGASWDDSIYRFDSSGTFQASIASGTQDLTDIDVSTTGDIVVGSRFDTVVQTTEALSSTSRFTITSSFQATFVAWVEAPVPVELMSFSVE